MAKTKLSFVELHTPLFMQGTNLGHKINAAQRHAVLEFDLERQLLFVHFKQKVAIIPSSNVASMDVTDPTELGIEDLAPKTRKSKAALDAEAKDAALKLSPKVDSTQSKLIEQARAVAAGQKINPQVADPTKPVTGLTGIQGKAKYMTHEQLAAQIAREKAEP